MAEYSTRCGRIVKRPRRIVEFKGPDNVECFIKEEEKERKSEENRKWVVEDVLERDGDRVFVKWQGFDPSFNSWDSLEENPWLSSFLETNAGNPYSSTVISSSLPSMEPHERELWLVKHTVFDELKLRTPDGGDQGVSQRVQVKVPFPKESFVSLFGKGTFPLLKERELDFSGRKNVRFGCTADELASVFGKTGGSRRFSDSSTVVEVDPAEKVYVSWGFELRINYDHSSCPRCTYTGDEGARPALCEPRKRKYPPLAFLTLSSQNEGETWL